MKLTDSGEIGGVEVPNRGVFRPVRTRFTADGIPAEELTAYFRTRAEGGTGLIVGPAQMLVHPSASGPSYINAYDDSTTAAFRSITSAVHDAGAVIFGQLTHPGDEETGDWEMNAQLAPSPTASNAAYEMPKAMDNEEIEAVKRGFVTAARNLETAGFDGVELNAGPFSVLRQFLSPKYNAREDEYGGDWKARAAFVNETIDAVTEATEEPVGLHLSLAELEYGGYEFDDVPNILDALDGFDYLSTTVGTRATYNQTHVGLAGDSPDLIEPTRTAANAVSKPVMGRQPFTTVADADALFDAGVGFVCFTRQLLADAQTLAKAATGDRFDRCIQCNQKCVEGVYGHAHGGHVECVVEPRTGRESGLPPLTNEEPAAIPQQVLVVGGGAAGMRFAAIAAERGHDVTLHEASDELGGQLRLAAQGPLEPLGRAVEDLEAAMDEASVTVELDTPVEPDEVDPAWDAVVVATGAERPDVGGYDFEGDVVDAFDVLDGTDVDGDVLLVDENRWVITFQTGLALAAQAESLEIATTDHYPGMQTEQPNLPDFIAALQAQGATFTGNRTVESVADDGTVTLRNTLTGDRETRTPETVVVAGRRRADEECYLELDERRDSVYRIGDAVSPRKLDRAYYDGEMLARRL